VTGLGNEGIEIRETRQADMAALERLYPETFPDEDLLPLVRDLHRKGSGVVSFIAHADEAVLGHVVFTICGIAGQTAKVALLGPLAVAPARQGRGTGSAIVRAGLHHLEIAGTTRVFVLGDPAYYGRFGFKPDDRVSPPYPLPAEWRDAWQSLPLGRVHDPLAGTLDVPRPWQHSALWAA